VRLFFPKADQPFKPDLFVTGQWQEDWYATVLEMPVREMLGESVLQLAEELLLMTAAPDWVEAERRPVKVGDMFGVEASRWLFIFTNQSAPFVEAGMDIRQLHAWPQAAVVQLTEPTKEPVNA
jgi:hypothetical protein